MRLGKTERSEFHFLLYSCLRIIYLECLECCSLSAWCPVVLNPVIETNRLCKGSHWVCRSRWQWRTRRCRTWCRRWSLWSSSRSWTSTQSSWWKVNICRHHLGSRGPSASSSIPSSIKLSMSCSAPFSLTRDKSLIARLTVMTSSGWPHTVGRDDVEVHLL